MATKLQDLKERYPQYGHLSDEELGVRLYESKYKAQGWSVEDFRAEVGLHDLNDPMRPLREHAQTNIEAGTTVKMAEGTASVRSGSVEDERLNNGWPTLIPFQWGGELLDQEQAVERAIESGKTWPWFETNDLATEASKELSGSLRSSVDEAMDTPDDALDPSPFSWTNIAKLVGQRATSLAGGLIGGLGTTIESGLEAAGVPESIRGGGMARSIAEGLKGVDLGGEHTAGPESISEAYEAGDIAGVVGETLKFGVETGLESIPDMIAVMTTLPAYVAARAGEMMDVRAENKGIEEAGAKEYFESIPFALGSALLERVGVRGILEPAEKLGKEAIKRGLSAVAKQAGRGATREAMTEMFQEGIIEYVGEKWGTDAALSWREAAERGAWASLAGGTFGGMAGATVGAGREAKAIREDRAALPEEYAEAPGGPPEGEPSAEPPVEPEPPPPTPAEPEPGDTWAGLPETPQVLADDTPEPAEGFVRLYRGQHPTDQDRDVFETADIDDRKIGGWFTTDKDYADYFRETQAQGRGGAEIVFVDVPESELEQYAVEGTPLAGVPIRKDEGAYFIPKYRVDPGAPSARFVELSRRVRRVEFDTNEQREDPDTGKSFTAIELMDQLESEGKERDGDEFSRRRGYTPEQIAEFNEYLAMVETERARGVDTDDLAAVDFRPEAPRGTIPNEEFRTAQEAAKAAAGTDVGALNEIMDIGEAHGLGQITQDEAIERLRNVRPAPEPEPAPEPAETTTLSLPTTAAARTAGNNSVPTYQDLPLSPDHGYQLATTGRPVTIPKKEIRREHIIKLLERTFGTQIYMGRVKGNTRLGFYRKKLGEIRIKYTNDLEVTAHEVGHWLDDRHQWISTLYKQHKREMKGVSYDVEKTNEGFAEFMRLFFTQEHKAREYAPAFYDAFVAELNTHPYAKDLFRVQEAMHAWMLQGVKARFASKIGDAALPLTEMVRGARGRIADYMLQKTLDELRSFKQAERAMTGTVGIANISAWKSLRIARGHRSVMESVYHDGSIGWDEIGDIVLTGIGIKQVFAPTESQMKEMQMYMVARRAQELLDQGRENLIKPDEIRYGLQLGEDNPHFKQVFDDWLAFSDRMMEFYKDSGLVGEEQLEMIREMNKNYVPFNRIIEAAEAIGLGKTKVANHGSPLMRLHGGTGNINDVFDSIVGNTAHMIHLSLINRGKTNFYNMVEQSDNQTGALYAVKIPTDVRRVSIPSNQVVQAIVNGFGMTMRDFKAAQEMAADGAESDQVSMIQQAIDSLPDYIEFFETGIAPKGNVDFYLRDGKPEYYEVQDRLLLDSINHIGPKSHNLMVNIMGGFANVLRAGVTLTPQFQMKNFLRDSMQALTLSKGRFIPLVGATSELVQRIFNDEHYWEYMANGGGFASMAEADGITQDKIFDGSKSMLQKLASALSTAEYANRVAEYTALRKKGYTRQEATFWGREISTDFAMRGSSDSLRILTLSIPFLNARLQGHYRIAREIGSLEDGKLKFAGGQAVAYAMRATLAITIPSLVLYAFNRDDERYQMLPDYVKDLSWVFFYGPGEDDYILIPKPFETGLMFGSLPERTFEYWAKEDGEEFANAAMWMILQSFGADLVPQMIRPAYDLARNKTFTGAPIVPEYMKGIESSEQWRGYTSDSLIALGRKLNISPIKAEYLVRGYLGTLGLWALGVSDYLIGDLSAGGVAPERHWQDNFMLSPFVNKGPLRRTDAEDDFYELLKSARVVASTVRLMQERSPERLMDYLTQVDKLAFFGITDALEVVSFQVRQMKNAIDKITADPQISAEQKYEQIAEIRRALNEIFTSAMQDAGGFKEVVRETRQQLKEGKPG